MKYYSIREDTITDIADAIRSKTGSTETISANEMAEKIEGIIGTAEAPELPDAEDVFFGTDLEAFNALKYIESTGTQYIDTGFFPTKNTHAEITYSVLNKNAEAPHILSSNCLYFPLIRFNTNPSNIFANRYGAQTVVTKEYTLGEVITAKAFLDNKVIVNGEQIATASTIGTKTNTTNLYLFTPGDAIGNSKFTGCVRLFGCKIWDGETLVRDFIPAIDDNEVICLYDNVSKSYFYNNGTGDFIGEYYYNSDSDEYKIQGETLTAIADAIREKKDTTAVFTPEQMATEITGIVTGDNLPDAEDAFFGSNDSVVLERGVTFGGRNAFQSKGYSNDFGYEFVANVDCAVYGFWGATDGSGELRLWDESSGAVIATMWQSKTEATSGGYQTMLPDPVKLFAGKKYAVTKCPSSGASQKYTSVSSATEAITPIRACRNSSSREYPSGDYADDYPYFAIDILIGDIGTASVTEYKIQTATMDNLADAIREKAGVEQTISPAQMIAIVDSVNLNLQEKTVTPAEEVQTVTPDSGYYGLYKVTVGAAIMSEELPSVLDYTFGIAENSMELAVVLSNENGTVASSGTTVERGYSFYPKEEIAIYGIRVNQTSDDSSTCYVRDNQKILHMQKVGRCTTWTDIMFDSPVTLNANTNYCISLNYTSKYINDSTVTLTYSSKLSSVQTKYSSSTIGRPTKDLDSSQKLMFSFYIGPAVVDSQPPEYEVTKSTMDGIATEVMRISGTEEKMSVSEMQSELEAVVLQEKTVTPSSEVQEIVPDDGYYGLSKVTVKAAEGGGGSAQPFGYATNHMSFPRLNVTTTATGTTV